LIEKSLDQENWSPVTKVSSIKSHEEQHTYEISEIDFAEGVNEYFRVVRVDANGERTEMDRVNINRPVLTNMLLIPVPRKVNKEMTLSYDSMIASDGTLTVMSRSGEIVEQFDVLISEGYNRFKLHIKDYEKGEYLATIRDEYGNKISKRLVIR
jgi:ribulose bisphosphate carboxylase small subunit